MKERPKCTAETVLDILALGGLPASHVLTPPPQDKPGGTVAADIHLATTEDGFAAWDCRLDGHGPHRAPPAGVPVPDPPPDCNAVLTWNGWAYEWIPVEEI